MEWANEKLLVYKDVDREVSNLDNILLVLKQHSFNGVLQLKNFGEVTNIPIIEGQVYGSVDEDFLVFSLYRSSKNFIINYFQLPVKLSIQYRETEPVWLNLESFGMNLKELFRKLEKMGLTGYIKVRNRIKRKDSYIFLNSGYVIAGESEGFKGVGVIENIIGEIKDYPCDVNVYSVSSEELTVYLSKWKYVSSATSPEIVDELVQDMDLYYIQLSTPESVAGFVDIQDIYHLSHDTPSYFEVYRIEKLISEFKEVDIYNYLSDFDKINVIKPQDLSILYFCPACWSQINSDDQVCPNCGYNLQEYHNMDYEYKLLMALEHPVKEWRKNTVHVIGLKRLEEAVPYLDLMIDKENDPFILMEIVDTLKKIGTVSTIPLLEKLSLHKYALVRNKAKQTLFLVSKQFNRL